jgi:hypothetical protein
MSINKFPINDQPFPKDMNVRIAIAGLAVCDLAKKDSIVRFLTHVLNHELKMRIVQKDESFNILGEVSFTLDKKQNISITGGVDLRTYIHKPSSYKEYPLNMTMDLTFLHGNELSRITPLIPPSITMPCDLVIDYAAFYTAKLTDKKFNLMKKEEEIKIERKFGEILGGYMQTNQYITVEIKNYLPFSLRLPVANEKGIKYYYEIDFNNSCVDEDGCKEDLKKLNAESGSKKTDFSYIYDILKDDLKPEEQFDLRRLDTNKKRKKDIGTGACLPTVRKPCTNC